MKHLYFCLPLLLLFTSCLEEENDFIPGAEVVTTSHDLFVSMNGFTDEEFEMLSTHLDINQNFDIPSEFFPNHLTQLSGRQFIDHDQNNQISALLGRMLFYDKRLSVTGEISCASCHKAELGFGDDVAFSKGISGQVTERNSIALASVPTFISSVSGYSGSGNSSGFGFFWDGRARDIQEQCRETIANPIEMGRNIHTFTSEIREDAVYQPLLRRIRQANNTSTISSSNLTRALEDFCHTITSINTPIDRFRDAQIRSEDPRELATLFGEEVVAGSVLFKTNCATCHGESFAKPTVEKANNGLALEYADKGFGVTFNAANFNGVFKVPFLRNVELTAPYMHDGSLATLRDVIDHYSDGIQHHPQLHGNLLDEEEENPKRMDFTEAEKDALIAYLKLATDNTLTEREHLQNPWRE